MRKIAIALIMIMMMSMIATAEFPSGWIPEGDDMVVDTHGVLYTKDSAGYYTGYSNGQTYQYHPSTNQVLIKDGGTIIGIRTADQYASISADDPNFDTELKKYLNTDPNPPTGGGAGGAAAAGGAATGGAGGTGGQQDTAAPKPLFDIGGGTGAGTGTGVGGEQKPPVYYQTPDGKIYPVQEGQTIPAGGKTVPQSTVTALQNAVQQYGNPTGYINGQYTFKPSVTDDPGLIEDYRHTTTATVKINPDGSSTTTTTVKHAVCGAGLDSCDGKTYTTESVEGQAVTTGGYMKDGKAVLDSKNNPITGVTSKEIITYRIVGGNPVPTTSRETIYKVDARTGTYSTSAMNVYTYDATGKKSDKPVYTIDANGNTNLDKDAYNNLSELDKKAVDKERDKANVAYVNSGAAGWKAFSILGTARVMGRFMRAYDEYAGLRQYSAIGLDSYEAQVKERKMRIQQEFCLASGITNCIVSSICGKIAPIKSDNVVAGRGPGGQFVTSAVLNAERSLAIEIEGMTRQQLIDMFGNQTIIAGRLINLTDPKFDPKVLGKMKLRMYHVQYQITNNVKSGKDMDYNIEFKRGAQASNSTYGPAVKQAKWYSPDQNLEFQKSVKDDLYKFSATEYNVACLTFEPGLPSGPPGGQIPSIGSVRVVRSLCVTIQEYAGGPTEIAQPGTASGGAGGAAAPAGTTPGAMI